MSIEEIIMREDMFLPKALDFPFGESEARLRAVGIEMPEFRTFDEDDPTSYLKYSEEDKVFYSDETDLESEKPYGIYRDLKAKGFDVIVHQSALDSGQIDGVDGMWSVASERKGFRTAMIGPVDTRGLDFAHFYHWLKEARHWIENPDDFMAAYGFLEGHPAFWKRPRPETHPNEWTTDDGVSTIWSSPTRREDGSIVMMMETGSMVPPERKHRYHDLRLDTYEDTYEKGIIATAKLVHKFNDLDGSERPDVDYEKSELEVILEERMAEVDKALAVDKAEEA
jgi:hypothetical protein